MFNKKIIAIAVLGFSVLTVANSHAAPYVGGQLGYGNVHQFTGIDNGKDTGIAGRLFAGYQFNDYFATEMGWSKFSNATTSLAFSDTDFNGYVKGTVKTDAVDLVVKGILPVTAQMNVYGKLGGAYVVSRGNINVSYVDSGYSYSGSYSETERKLLPTAGVGASYAINNNLAADISYNRIQKVGNNSSFVNSTDLVSLGLIYSIG